jgi:predicted nuclease of predicted toxin-antitoxin system
VLRLISDENIHGDVVRGLRRRQPDLDIVRVQEVGLLGADDTDILEWAAAEGRILLTRDRNTMVGFAYDRVIAGLPMPGVFVLREDLTIGQAIDAVLLMVLCSEQDEWKARVEFLPL